MWKEKRRERSFPGLAAEKEKHSKKEGEERNMPAPSSNISTPIPNLNSVCLNASREEKEGMSRKKKREGKKASGCPCLNAPFPRTPYRGRRG